MRTQTLTVVDCPSRELLFDSLRIYYGLAAVFVVIIKNDEDREVIKGLSLSIQNLREFQDNNSKKVMLAVSIDGIAVNHDLPDKGTDPYRNSWIVSGKPYNYKTTVLFHINTKTRRGKMQIQLQ